MKLPLHHPKREAILGRYIEEDTQTTDDAHKFETSTYVFSETEGLVNPILAEKLADALRRAREP